MFHNFISPRHVNKGCGKKCWLEFLDTAEYYTETNKVMNMSSTTTVLAGSTAACALGAVAPVSSVAQVSAQKMNCAIFLLLSHRFRSVC